MIEKITHFLPFAAMVSNHQQNSPMITRLVEQAIVGIAAAFMAIYVSDIRQSEQILIIKESVARIEKAVEKIQHDLYVPIGKNK